MSGLYVRRRRKAEINIVPLIDVLTMLIFFFLVTMQFREMATLNLTLPKMETAGKSVFENQVVIAIDADEKIRLTILDRNGDLVFDKADMKEDELEGVAVRLREVDKDITILIRSDENTPLKIVTKAMDICRKNGLNKIRLQTKN
ncbi:MAG TPA: biopolymer transporter ExbD [Opitutaceae bacterium]